MSQARRAICLVIDRLSAAYVGALGNTWVKTPAFDTLAARSVVFDRALVDSPALDDAYRSYWLGRPAWLDQPRNDPGADISLPEYVRQAGAQSILLNDDPHIATNPLAAAFDDVIRLDEYTQSTQGADWPETQLAAFFAEAIELLDSSRSGLVWLHTGALGRIWDSPQALREQYADEDDPPAPDLAVPPSLLLGDDADPDFLLGLRHAYAGEVSVVDHCVDMLFETIDSSDWRDALLCVLSPRGFPLGEHGVVGGADVALYGELLHVPMLIRLPHVHHYGIRSQAIVQPIDLHATLRDWFAPDPLPPNSQPQLLLSSHSLMNLDGAPTPRNLALASSPSGEIALTTPAWFARASTTSENQRSAHLARGIDSASAARKLELFVKPDDYFEVNEVSDRCLDVADEFCELVRLIEDAKQLGVMPQLALSDALIYGSDTSRFAV